MKPSMIFTLFVLTIITTVGVTLPLSLKPDVETERQGNVGPGVVPNTNAGPTSIKEATQLLVINLFGSLTNLFQKGLGAVTDVVTNGGKYLLEKFGVGGSTNNPTPVNPTPNTNMDNTVSPNENTMNPSDNTVNSNDNTVDPIDSTVDPTDNDETITAENPVVNLGPESAPRPTPPTDA